MSSREEIIEKVGALESIPSSKLELISLLQDPDVEMGKLASTIEMDPALTLNLLRLANSVYFGCPKEVATVKEAINRLGTSNIFKLVVTSVAAPVVKKEVEGYDLAPRDLLKHSLSVAVGSEKLSRALNVRLPDLTFTAGILHDIGKVILGDFIQVDASPIMNLAIDQQVSFEEAERQILGIDHAELGAILLENWNLPSSVVDVVRWHHQPESCESEDNTVLYLIHIADSLSMMSGIGVGSDGLNYRINEEIIKRLKITVSNVEFVVSEILGGLLELDDLLSV